MALSKWPEVEQKLILVEAWCRDGLTEEDISKKLGISVQTLNVYKKEHPEFLESLKKGKEVADVEVENSLFKRANGYRYDEITYEDGVETKRVTKEVQPDVTAQIFWLKNRKPEQWRDRKELEHSGNLVIFNGESDLQD